MEGGEVLLGQVIPKVMMRAYREEGNQETLPVGVVVPEVGDRNSQFSILFKERRGSENETIPAFRRQVHIM